MSLSNMDSLSKELHPYQAARRQGLTEMLIDALEVKLLGLAAEHGNEKAQLRLGVLCRNGLAIPAYNARVYAWMNIAATQGNLEALEYKNNILKNMTPSQIEEGQRLSREYAEKFRKK